MSSEAKSIYSPRFPERVVLLAALVPSFDVDSFGLSLRLSTVVRYYMKYTGLSFCSSPPVSFLDVLVIVRGANRVESEQELWVLVHI